MFESYEFAAKAVRAAYENASGADRVVLEFLLREVGWKQDVHGGWKKDV